MKLIHVQKARSIWLFDIRDLNPRGKDVNEDLIDWIKDSYHFATGPDLPAATLPGAISPITIPPNGPQSSGLVFQRGHFQVRDELFVEISSLSIFDDGIVVDTLSSTHDGDLFATDLLESAAREFTLSYEPEMIRRRMYVSEIVVRSELDLECINQKLAAFADRIADAFKSGQDQPEFRLSGLSYWSEPNEGGRNKIFSLERQAGRAFKERRYYSQAPIQTNDHLGLLEELERIMMP